jgi:hypothetical protein
MSNIPAKRDERIEWLKNPENRDPLSRRGAGSIYWRGDVADPDSVEIIVSTRSGNVGAGLAHFGGLGEDEDIIPGDDLKTGIRNALREGQEEMEELLGYQPDLKEERYTFLYAAKDDKFLINNGKGFAVDARLHAYETEPELWEALFPDNAKISHRDENHNGYQETDQAEVLTFKEALTRQEDYHYPHEYFALWVMAAKEMKADLDALAEEANAKMGNARVDFTKLADEMFVSLAELETHLGEGYQGVLQKYESRHQESPARRTHPGASGRKQGL